MAAEAITPHDHTADAHAAGRHVADNRRAIRIPVDCGASALLGLRVEILDASTNGMRARLSIPLPIGTTLKVKLPGRTERHARIKWADRDVVGCEFLAPLSPDETERVLVATRHSQPA